MGIRRGAFVSEISALPAPFNASHMILRYDYEVTVPGTDTAVEEPAAMEHMAHASAAVSALHYAC